jgi:hypothetical protein
VRIKAARDLVEYTGASLRKLASMSAKLVGKWHRHLSLGKLGDEEETKE